MKVSSSKQKHKTDLITHSNKQYLLTNYYSKTQTFQKTTKFTLARRLHCIIALVGNIQQ